MNLVHFDLAAHRARRARLVERIGDTPALIASGAPVPRTYAANVYPFRAASHFLYLIGLPLRESFALIEADRSTLFVPPPTVDDALWHGPRPGLAELAEIAGCFVRPIDALGDAIGAVGAARVATLAAIDLATQKRQIALLGRDIGPAASEADALLADAMIALRLVHDEAAQAGLRRAAGATAAAHLAGMAATRPGILEADVRAAMEAAIRARGMTTSYSSIVTRSGEVLHHESSHDRLEPGDLLLADVGAETEDGWAGDVTRTWPVTGRFSTTQREMYELVLAAQEAAIAAVAPSVRYRDVHLTASRVIAAGLVELGVLRGDPDELVADGVHALLFPHGVGHLLGMDVHDMEDLGDRAGYAPGRARSTQFGLGYLRLDRDLVPGMAVTIEPGFYQVRPLLDDPDRTSIARGRLDTNRLARFADVRGIRIEDDVLVTASGCEVLTRAIPKGVAEVEASVGRSAR